MGQVKKWAKEIGLVLLALLVFGGVIMFVNYQVPTQPFEIAEGKIKGQAFAWTTGELMRQELDWGWQPNDMLWPTRFLDNRPNFQIGVLDVVRRNAFCMWEYLSRQRMADVKYKELDDAFSSFSNGPKIWFWPPPEWKYATGNERLETYSQNLENQKSTFYPRADNLIKLVDYYRSTAGEANNVLMEASWKTPWMKIDDNFYYAKGVAWGLYHSMLAVKIDFARVLKDKNCEVLVDQILSDLRRCLDLDPYIVFNGGGGMANHSSNLSSPLSEAARKMENLVAALTTG